MMGVALGEQEKMVVPYLKKKKGIPV